MRANVSQLLNVVPFRPFVIVTDSGHRIVVRHSENVAFDPESTTGNCYVIADGLMHSLPWAKITCLGTP